MSTLDALLDMMSAEGASELLLRAGEVPRVVAPSGTRPVARSAISGAQVANLARAIADAATALQLAARSAVRFSYRGFSVDVVFPPTGATMRVTPAPLAPPLAGEGSAAPDSGGAVASRQAIDSLLAEMIRRGASDLHLTSGESPRLRHGGQMVAMQRAPVSREEMAELLWPIAPVKNREEWERCHDTDFA